MLTGVTFFFLVWGWGEVAAVEGLVIIGLSKPLNSIPEYCVLSKEAVGIIFMGIKPNTSQSQGGHSETRPLSFGNSRKMDGVFDEPPRLEEMIYHANEPSQSCNQINVFDAQSYLGCRTVLTLLCTTLSHHGI